MWMIVCLYVIEINIEIEKKNNGPVISTLRHISVSNMWHFSGWFQYFFTIVMMNGCFYEPVIGALPGGGGIHAGFGLFVYLLVSPQKR